MIKTYGKYFTDFYKKLDEEVQEKIEMGFLNSLKQQIKYRKNISTI